MFNASQNTSSDDGQTIARATVVAGEQLYSCKALRCDSLLMPPTWFFTSILGVRYNSQDAEKALDFVELARRHLARIPGACDELLKAMQFSREGR